MDNSATPRPTRDAWTKLVLHLTRRGHLYAGLLLVPWVFLYGITGFLFNHPEFLPDQTFISIGKASIRGTSLEQLPKPREIAAQVVALLNQQGGPQYTLQAPEKAQFGRGGLTVNLTDAEGTVLTAFLTPGGTGSIRPARGSAAGPAPGAAAPTRPEGRSGGEAGRPEGRRRPETAASAEVFTGDRAVSAVDDAGRREATDRIPAEGERRGRGGRSSGEGEFSGGPSNREGGARRDPPGEAGPRDGQARGPGSNAQETAEAPFAAAAGLMLEKSPLSLITEGIPTVLSRVGLTNATVTSVRATPLSFVVESEGKRWRAEYNLETGALTGRLEDPAAAAGQDLSFRRFLLRMHTTHGYPSDEVNYRWVWAVIVDVMSAVMCFWGISGIVMWWQIKRTRWLGGACLLLSMIAAIWIGSGMHELLAAAPR